MYVTRKELTLAINAVFATTLSYKSYKSPKSERVLDPILHAALISRGHDVRRQAPVAVRGTACRIDFETRGENPTFIEWAVRPPTGGGQLSRTSNQSELEKLARKGNSRRYLLLLDLTPEAERLDFGQLRADYARWGLGPGRFTRNSVNVIYAHRADYPLEDVGKHRFIWRP